MPYITYKSAPDTIGQGFFGATDYNNKKWSGYRVAFGKQHYLHKYSGKNVNNLIILGADLSDSNDEETVLILGKGSVQINNTTVQAKSELKKIVHFLKNLFCLYTIMVMIAVCLLIIFSNINSKQNILKLKQENCAQVVFQMILLCLISQL